MKGSAQLGAHQPVVISVRPENVHLSETPHGSGAQNVHTGIVYQKVFLGECVDFQIKIGETLLLARAHSSIRTPVGDSIHISMNPDECVVVGDAGAPRSSADHDD